MNTSAQTQAADTQNLGDKLGAALGTSVKATGRVLKDVGGVAYQGGLVGLYGVAAYGIFVGGCKLVNRYLGINAQTDEGAQGEAAPAPAAE